MPTTPLNSEFPGWLTPRLLVCVLLSVALPVVVAGCVPQHTQPAELFQLSPESNANRAMQTRFFETTNDKELLSASAAALQDLGFQVEESVREVGFLRAAKERSAREYRQYLNQFFVWLFSLGHLIMPVDLHQKVAATIVTRPLNHDGSRHELRIMFYRVLWKGEGQADRNYIPPGEQKNGDDPRS